MKNHIQELFDELKPGDRIEVERVVAEGRQRRTAKTCGCVVRTERRREELHFHGNHGERPAGDVILLELADGELTTVAVDESTVLRRA